MNGISTEHDGGAAAPAASERRSQISPSKRSTMSQPPSHSEQITDEQLVTDMYAPEPRMAALAISNDALRDSLRPAVPPSIGGWLHKTLVEPWWRYVEYGYTEAVCWLWARAPWQRWALSAGLGALLGVGLVIIAARRFRPELESVAVASSETQRRLSSTPRVKRVLVFRRRRQSADPPPPSSHATAEMDEDDDDSTVGWDAITAAAVVLYGDLEPIHRAPIPGPAIGGGVEGISADRAPDHWHLVRYGLSELYDKISDDPTTSGWGYAVGSSVRRDFWIPPTGEPRVAPMVGQHRVRNRRPNADLRVQGARRHARHARPSSFGTCHKSAFTETDTGGTLRSPESSTGARDWSGTLMRSVRGWRRGRLGSRAW